jgi:hypothetical protein
VRTSPEALPPSGTLMPLRLHVITPAHLGQHGTHEIAI